MQTTIIFFISIWCSFMTLVNILDFYLKEGKKVDAYAGLAVTCIFWTIFYYITHLINKP